MLRSKLLISVTILIVLVLAGCGTDVEQSVTFDSETFVIGEHYEDRRIYVSETTDAEIFIEKIPEEEWDYSVRVVRNTTEEEFLVSGTSRSYQVLFPDGRELRRTHQNSSSSGQTDPETETDFEDWDQVDDLGQMVYGSPEQADETGGTGNFLFGLVLVICGLVAAINPRLAFFLEQGWRMKDVEPSEVYLIVARVLGIVIALIGFIRLIM